MSEKGKIMELCRSIYNELESLTWNSLDLERCRQVNAAQQRVRELMSDVDRIPSVKRQIRPVMKHAERKESNEQWH